MEYEYSFKVDSLDEYKKYCEENGYEKRLEYDQVRELLRVIIRFWQELQRRRQVKIRMCF